MLGRLLLEGSSSHAIAKNESKGLSWVKESIKLGSIEALEYKTYWDIRFDKHPKMAKILESLETIIQKTKSPRALNTLAEFHQVQDKKEGSKEEAAKYYLMSAD